jgi:arylsulfatase A-like enzyme
MSPGTIVSNSSLGRFITWNRSLRRMVDYYQDLGRKSAESVNSQFLTWLSGREKRPFFVFLNYFDAHGPYVAPAPFNVKFGPSRPIEQNGTAHKSELSADEIAAMIDGYDSSIAYLDHELGRLMDELERRQVLDDTLVIITSDHGEEFGEHDVFGHGHTLYMPSVHVPLLVRFPGRTPAGASVSENVTLRDLPATIIDLLGGTVDATFPGRSLARLWSSAPEPGPLPPSSVLSEVSHVINAPPYLPVAKGDMKSVTLGTLRYIRNGDASEELYSLEDDTAERRNLARSEAGRPALSHMHEAFGTIWGRVTSVSPPAE